jgi:hypothetical protein
MTIDLDGPIENHPFPDPLVTIYFGEDLCLQTPWITASGTGAQGATAAAGLETQF